MKKWIVMWVITVFFTGGAFAFAEEGTFEKFGVACGAEIEKLCPKVAIGKGRILACLEKNQAKLSEECNKARVNAQKQFEENESAD